MVESASPPIACHASSSRHQSEIGGRDAWAVGLGLTGIISIAPLVFERVPADFVQPPDRLLGLDGRPLVLILMWLAIVYRSWLDRRWDSRPLCGGLVLAVIAIGLATWHRYAVDLAADVLADGSFYPKEDWQRQAYLHVLDREKTNPGGFSFVPHVFRPLPYGFARSIEIVTGDWNFACWSYRWFFTYWFLWACFRLVRRFQAEVVSWIVIVLITIMYPFSVWYYYGQLTDPMSHALFVLALIYILEDRWLPLAAALALGVAAKEIAIVLIPGYFVSHRQEYLRSAWRALGLLLVAMASYFATRWPLGWKLEFSSINATEAWMIASNLGMGADRHVSPAPIYQNYAFPLIFVGSFVPAIIVRWKRMNPQVRALVATVVPLILISNLCFGWLHEARNYLPLVPLLAVAALPPRGAMGTKIAVASCV